MNHEMIVYWEYTYSLLMGGLLGACFFGGLSWTLIRIKRSTHEVGWFIGSLAIRIIIIAAGFSIFSDGSFVRLLFCMLGFIIGRRIAIRAAFATT